MTTPPANEPSISHGWVTVDAAGTAPSQAARLDVSRDWSSAQRGRDIVLSLLDLRPGQRVLEVGPGNGAFAQQMAALVGNTGSVVGVDLSASLAAIATERAAGSGLPVTFQQGDVHQLEFPDATFDACFATLVFFHIEDPVRALQEMVRVTRPGGRVVISEPDFETAVFDAPNYEASRLVVDARNRLYRDPRLGRKLPRMFKEAGLADVVVETHALITPDRAAQWARVDYAGAVKRAIQEGRIEQQRADAWIDSLDAASREGHYFQATTYFSVAGRRQ